MKKTYCDFCGREIPDKRLGHIDDCAVELILDTQKLEICTLCGYRLKNFIEENLKENNNE